MKITVGSIVLFDNTERGYVTRVDDVSFDVQWESGAFSKERFDDMSYITVPIEKEQVATLGDYIASIQKKYPEDNLADASNSVVNKPKHYQIFPEYEVRDICKVMSGKIESKGYTAFFISDYVQMLQYALRFQDKNGKEDLEKCKYYLNKMLEQL